MKRRRSSKDGGYGGDPVRTRCARRAAEGRGGGISPSNGIQFEAKAAEQAEPLRIS